MTLVRSLAAAATLLALIAPASAKDGATASPAPAAEQSAGRAHPAGGPAAPQTAPAAGIQPAGRGLAVAIANEGRQPIWYVQMSPIEEQHYGADLLAPTETIDAGFYAVVTPENSVGACRFDILITYASGAELPIWDVNVCDHNVIFATETRYEIGYDATI